VKRQTKLFELVLTCASWQEAQKIADQLLGKKLVACVEFVNVKSRFWWKGSIDELNEVKIIMTTIENHFESIEAHIKSLHSYETFVLKAIPLLFASNEASTWLTSVTDHELSGN
jgi:periplasmic divalent cation tolerance protein